MGTLLGCAQSPVRHTLTVSPPGPFPFVCPIHLDGRVFNKKNGVWRHVHGPCAEGSVISLGIVAVSPQRETNRSPGPSVFTPAGEPYCTVGAPCSRQESRGGQWPKACAGRLQLDTGQEDEGEHWNLRPRRHCSRCSRMTQHDPEEGGWASGTPCWALLAQPCRGHMRTCMRLSAARSPGAGLP